MVTCNEAYLMAIIYRETFLVVTVVDKYLPSATVMGKVVDSSSKSGNPDTSFHGDRYDITYGGTVKGKYLLHISRQ